MGSPEVSNFSVEYLLRSKASDETPQYNGVRDDHLYRAQHPVDVSYPSFYTAVVPPAVGGRGTHSQTPACCRPAAAGCCGVASFLCYPVDFTVPCSGVQPWRFLDGEVPQPQYGYLPHAAEPRRGSRSRSRTVFTEIQTQQLELLFSRTDYPTPDEREELARSTGLSHEVIRVWFKNRRARRKNQNAPGSPNTNPAEEARNERTNERS